MNGSILQNQATCSCQWLAHCATLRSHSLRLYLPHLKSSYLNIQLLHVCPTPWTVCYVMCQPPHKPPQLSLCCSVFKMGETQCKSQWRSLPCYSDKTKTQGSGKLDKARNCQNLVESASKACNECNAKQAFISYGGRNQVDITLTLGQTTQIIVARSHCVLISTLSCSMQGTQGV